MRTALSCGCVLLAIAMTGAAGHPKAPPKPTADDFYGVWIEERRESGGKVETDPFHLLGWDLAAADGGCWERRGESVYSGLGRVRVRADKDPVWLDFIGTTFKQKVGDGWVERVHIRPGIVKRDGKKLVWVWASGWMVADPKDVPDWSKRPTSFDVKKDDPWEKMTLYRSSGRYTTD
jgi:hypothetical protein